MDLRTIELKISRSENLPVLPEVISTVYRTADNSGSSSKDLEKLILHDPALTAKVIRVANSPLYGTYRVPTVGRALNVLGMSKAKNLLISLVLQQLAVAKQMSRQFNQHDYWSHSLAVGSAAKILASYKAPFMADQLYCAGIMHDIGLLVMDKFCPQILDAVIEKAGATGKTLCETEPSVAAFGHAQVGEILAKQWGMDDMTISAIGSHHNPAPDSKYVLEVRILNVADQLAHEVGFKNQTPRCTSYQVTPEMLQQIGVAESNLENIKVQMVEELEEAKKCFGAAA